MFGLFKKKLLFCDSWDVKPHDFVFYPMEGRMNDVHLGCSRESLSVFGKPDSSEKVEADYLRLLYGDSILECSSKLEYIGTHLKNAQVIINRNEIKRGMTMSQIHELVGVPDSKDDQDADDVIYYYKRGGLTIELEFDLVGLNRVNCYPT